MEPIELDCGIKRELNSRLVLAFTGKPRLAKDILVNVLKRWTVRERGTVRRRFRYGF